ncbi:MAG: phosphatase PAP2 family protein [Pseudohongiella sp.]|nr:phosphatase PAP2 family protein [Pseudohongiella sp.]
MTKIIANCIPLLYALQRLDEAAFHKAFRSDRARAPFRKISSSADGHLYLICALFCWIWIREPGSHFLSLLCISFMVERPIYLILKNGLKRNRPAQIIPGFTSIIVPSDHFSFPSGHTSGAFIFATALSLSLADTNFIAGVNSETLMVIAVYCWAVMVGLSRVMLGVHFPGDTLAGATLGSLTTVSIHYAVLL